MCRHVGPGALTSGPYKPSRGPAPESSLSGVRFLVCCPLPLQARAGADGKFQPCSQTGTCRPTSPYSPRSQGGDRWGLLGYSRSFESFCPKTLVLLRPAGREQREDNDLRSEPGPPSVVIPGCLAMMCHNLVPARGEEPDPGWPASGCGHPWTFEVSRSVMVGGALTAQVAGPNVVPTARTMAFRPRRQQPNTHLVALEEGRNF